MYHHWLVTAKSSRHRSTSRLSTCLHMDGTPKQFVGLQKYGNCSDSFTMFNSAHEISCIEWASQVSLRRLVGHTVHRSGITHSLSADRKAQRGSQTRNWLQVNIDVPYWVYFYKRYSGIHKALFLTCNPDFVSTKKYVEVAHAPGTVSFVVSFLISQKPSGKWQAFEKER